MRAWMHWLSGTAMAVGMAFAGIPIPLQATEPPTHTTTATGSPLATSGQPATAHGVLYGFGSPDPARPGGFSAVDLASGRLLGWVPPGGGQGSAWALAPDGRRAYLLDSDPAAQHAIWRLTELATPSLRVVRRAPVPNAIRLLGAAPVVAVAPDGRTVYVHTLESRAHPGEYAHGGDDAVIGVAVYDVARGAVVRTLRLGGGSCGRLAALPDGLLLAFCGGAVNWIDPRRGTLVETLGLSVGSLAIGPDGRRAWHVTPEGWVSEVDVERRQVTRRLALPDTPPGASAVPGGPAAADFRVPFQTPTVSPDGARLVILGTPSDQVGGFGRATRAWIVETRTLTIAAVVPLPAAAAEAASVTAGQLLVASVESGDQGAALRLVEVPSGREVRRWGGPLALLVVAPAPGLPRLGAGGMAGAAAMSSPAAGVEPAGRPVRMRAIRQTCP